MNSRSILRHVRKLENSFGAFEPENDLIDIVMWDAAKGGMFGHAHCLVSKSGGQTVWLACSDEEEVEIMREYYERDGLKVSMSGEPGSFVEFLEHHNYLGSEVFESKRKEIIERLRGEKNGGCAEREEAGRV
jgi:hypothetical protein